MKKFISIFLVFVFAFSLCACSNGGISGDEAKSFVNEFLEKIEAENYTEAEKLLHPERPANLQAFFEGMATEKEIDFSNINIEKYTGFKSSFYDSSVNGSTYSLTMQISASGKIAVMKIELVKNDNGYGIYNLNIDFD